MIVKVRGTDVSMGYGFAEFHTVTDAKAAREKSKRLDHQCTVSSQRFWTDFPHAGVFPPASVPGEYGPTGPEFTFTTGTGRVHRYYDERYHTTPYSVNESAPEMGKDPKEVSNTTANNNIQTGSKRGNDTSESQQSKPKKMKKSAGPVLTEQVQNWQNKYAELRGEPEETETETVRTISEPRMSDEQSFAVDTEEYQRCYLCNTKFSSSKTLLRHLQASETHAAFAKDEKRRQRGTERLEKIGIDLATTVKIPMPQSAPARPGQQRAAEQPRDRAAERRQAEPKIGFSLSAAQKSRPGSSGSEGGKPTANKGLGMMKGMGYLEGQGLGDGSGRAAPIEQSMFVPGVGLGHEGGVRGDAVEEAARRTKGESGAEGRGGFLEGTRENAREEV